MFFIGILKLIIVFLPFNVFFLIDLNQLKLKFFNFLFFFEYFFCFFLNTLFFFVNNFFTLCFFFVKRINYNDVLTLAINGDVQGYWDYRIKYRIYTILLDYWRFTLFYIWNLICVFVYFFFYIFYLNFVNRYSVSSFYFIYKIILKMSLVKLCHFNNYKIIMYFWFIYGFVKKFIFYNFQNPDINIIIRKFIIFKGVYNYHEKWSFKAFNLGLFSKGTELFFKKDYKKYNLLNYFVVKFLLYIYSFKKIKNIYIFYFTKLYIIKFFLSSKKEINFFYNILYFFEKSNKYIWFFLLNMLNLIYLFFFLILSCIKILILLILKKRKYIVYFILLFIFFYLFWFIEYCLKEVWFHYTLNLPFNNKVNLRFFNYEMLDLRNFFKVLSLKKNIEGYGNNSLNIEVLKSLNTQLNNVYFKPNYQGNIYMYNLKGLNGDVILLNNILKKYNNTKSFTWFRMLNQRQNKIWNFKSQSLLRDRLLGYTRVPFSYDLDYKSKYWTPLKLFYNNAFKDAHSLKNFNILNRLEGSKASKALKADIVLLKKCKYQKVQGHSYLIFNKENYLKILTDKNFSFFYFFDNYKNSYNNANLRKLKSYWRIPITYLDNNKYNIMRLRAWHCINLLFDKNWWKLKFKMWDFVFYFKYAVNYKNYILDLYKPLDFYKTKLLKKKISIISNKGLYIKPNFAIHYIQTKDIMNSKIWFYEKKINNLVNFNIYKNLLKNAKVWHKLFVINKRNDDLFKSLEINPTSYVISDLEDNYKMMADEARVSMLDIIEPRKESSTYKGVYKEASDLSQAFRIERRLNSFLFNFNFFFIKNLNFIYKNLNFSGMVINSAPNDFYLINNWGKSYQFPAMKGNKKLDFLKYKNIQHLGNKYFKGFNLYKKKLVLFRSAVKYWKYPFSLKVETLDLLNNTESLLKQRTYLEYVSKLDYLKREFLLLTTFDDEFYAKHKISVETLNKSISFAEGSYLQWQKIRNHRNYLKFLKKRVIRLAHLLRFYKEYVYLPMADDVNALLLNVDINSNLEKEKQINFYNLRLSIAWKQCLQLFNLFEKEKRRMLYVFNSFKKLHSTMKNLELILDSNKVLIKNKVNTMRLKTLRKIYRLKKLTYIQQKENKFSFFKYCKSFSIEFHLKHLLWHSPYSNLNFFEYIDYNTNLGSKKYSSLLNFYYNLGFIKEDCKFYNSSNIQKPNLDLYNVLSTLIYDYYIDFLKGLIRYSYLLEKYNLTLFYFLKRKLYYIFWRERFSIPIELRTEIQKQRKIYNKNDLKKYFDIDGIYMIFKKHLNVYKYNVFEIPFWLIYNYWIQKLVIFILNVYYNNENFIYWWVNLNFFLGKNELFYFILLSKIFESFVFLLKFYSDFKIFKNLIFFWYLNLCLKVDFSFFENLNFWKIYVLFKLMFIKNLIFLKKNVSLIDLNKNLYFKMDKILNYKHFFFIFFDYKNEKFIFMRKDININASKIFRLSINKYKTRLRNYKKYIWLNRPFKRTLPFNSKNSHNLYHKTMLFSFFNSFHFFSLRSFYLIYDTTYLFNLINNNDIYSIPVLKRKIFGFDFLQYYYIFYLLYFLFLSVFFRLMFRFFFFKVEEEYVSTFYWDVFRARKINTFFSSSFNKKKFKFFFMDSKNFEKGILSYLKKDKIAWLLSKTKAVGESELFLNNKYGNTLNLTKVLNSIYIYFYNLDKYVFNFKLPAFVFFKDNYILKAFNFRKFNFVLNKEYINEEPLFFFCFFYWLFIIPIFFLKYVYSSYHLNLGKHNWQYKFFVFLKSILDSLDFFVFFVRVSDKLFFNSRYYRRYMDIQRGRRKTRRLVMIRQFRSFDYYYNISSLGGYYYWFHNIDIAKFYLYYKDFYIRLVFFSNFYYKLYFLFLLILIIYIKIKIKNIIYKVEGLLFFNLNIVKYISKLKNFIKINNNSRFIYFKT